MKMLLMSSFDGSLNCFIFCMTWQYSSFSLLTSPFVFYALMREFFSFLKLIKSIIKEATMIKNGLTYRISIGDFYIYIIPCFCCF